MAAYVAHTLEAFDKTPLNVRHYAPAADRTVKGTVLVVHGYAEHLGRYEDFAGRLHAAGYGVVTFDLRGHGTSGGVRGHVMAWEHYTRDVDQLLAFTAEAAAPHKDRPLFIVGHSNGGLITLHRLLQDAPLPVPIRGVVVTSPFLGLQQAVNPFMVALGSFMSMVAPTVNVPISIEPVSRDNEVWEAYRMDPLVFKTANARWASLFPAAQAFVLNNIAKISVPALFIQGGADRIVKVSTSRKVAQKAGADKIKYIELEGFYHEVFNEPLEERNKAYAALLEQLDAWSSA